ncbi:MAG: hypothetical protein JWP12_3436 [Bacteroidetes bacterium]|nr:hypothetical protein [Bacteroidota bacterium]
MRGYLKKKDINTAVINAFQAFCNELLFLLFEAD